MSLLMREELEREHGVPADSVQVVHMKITRNALPLPELRPVAPDLGPEGQAMNQIQKKTTYR